MSIYITYDDIKDDKTLAKVASYTSWTQTDWETRIDESESYVESALVKLGYTRTQLQTASVVYQLCKLYCYYAIMRDVYTQTSPGKGNEERYDKWKKAVDDWIEKIKNNELALVDNDGNIISAVDNRYKPLITTDDTKRIITLQSPENWDIDNSNYSEKTIGKGGTTG